MSYIVAIRNNETGEVRTYTLEGLDWEDHSLFWWTEGNFACDCNRYLCFERAAGHEPTDEEDEQFGGCGDSRYTALYAELSDGQRIEIDSPPTQMQNPDDIGRCGIELIMQGREKEGRAMVLEATRLENEARREAYRRYMLQMADQKASREAEGDPDR